MSMFRREKSLSSTPFTTKNSMACKFRRLWRRLVEVSVRWVSVLFTPFSIRLKKRGLLNPAGETKDVRSEGEPDDAITNSLVAGLPPLKPSSLSDPTFSHGRLLDFLTKQSEELDHSIKELERSLEEMTAKLEILEKESKLQKRLRKYKQFEPAETWASRWVASPIAYLFPEEVREEWLGDLYEVNREMIRKGYGRWLVNLINVGRIAILVLSAVQIKVSDFIAIAIPRAVRFSKSYIDWYALLIMFCFGCYGMNFSQVVLSAMMPYFYTSLLVCGILGLKFGILRDRDFSVVAIVAIFVLSKLTPLLFSGLSETLLRGCLYSAIIGITVGYLLRQLTGLIFRFV